MGQSKSGPCFAPQKIMRGFPNLLVPIIRQSFFGLALLFVSLPLLRGLHNRFSLGAPPTSALLLIAICVLIIFIGAGMIGAFSGSSAKASNGAVPMLIALALSLGWGLLVCSIVVPFYASSVVDHMTQSVALDAVRDRGAVIDKTRGAYDAVRSGKTGEFVGENRDIAWTKSKALLSEGAARLPAIGLLAIAVIGAPLGAAFECWRARRR